MNEQEKLALYKFNPNEYPLEPGLRLLEASAGTGKTFALAHLVLRLITERNHSINELLVVTFTEAAASELRARISTRIEEALAGLESLDKGLIRTSPDKVLEQWLELNGQEKAIRRKWGCLLLEALESIDCADITTIHGFCRRTLRREALDSNTSINPLVEEDSSELALEIIHDYWHSQVLSLSPRQLKGLKKANLSIEKLSQVLLTIDSDPSLQFKVDNNKIDISKPLVSQFDNWVQEYWYNFLSLWKQGGHLLESYLQSQASQWRSLGIKDTKPFSPKPIKNRFEILNKWVESFSEELDESTPPKSPSYEEIRSQNLLGNYFHPAVIVDTAQRCGEKTPILIRPFLQEAIAALWDGPAENVWVHCLAWSLNELDTRRKTAGVFSYGGLLKGLDPGTCPTGKKLLIDKLRSRYRATLIDEFQDTDSIQWRLLMNAFGQSPDHLLLMVGDPKQAIYRFRGGDLSIYMKARKSVDRIDELLDNYRTSTPLMQRLNQLFSTGLIYSKLNVPKLNPCSESKGDSITTSHNSLKILTIEGKRSQDNNNSNLLISKSQLEETIPTAVANEILELLNNQPKNLKPSDICILVNRHQQAERIRDGLAIAGVPSRLVSQGDIFQCEAADVLQRFLDCLARPSYSSSLRLVACTLLLQWDITKLKEAERNGELDALAVQFKYWSKNFSKLGLIGCLGELLEGKTLADLSERGRILVDLYQCSQLVQEEVHRQGLDAMSAARWLKRQRLNPVGHFNEEREPHSDVEESAVNVVTIHRSKGLEYQVVICPYLWQSPPKPLGPLWRVNKTGNWQITLNSKWGKGKESADEAKYASLQEAERLCYVALTRAKHQLIIVWAKGAKQENNPLQSLLFGPDSLGYETQNLGIEHMNKWLKKNNVQVNSHTAKTIKVNGYWRPTNTTRQLTLGPVPQRRLDVSWGRNSYSSLVKSSDNHYGYSSVFLLEEKETDLENKEILTSKSSTTRESVTHPSWSASGPLGDFPRGPVAGDCLHRILEKLSFSKPLNSPETTLQIEEELLKAGLDTNFVPSVQKGLTRVLNTPLGGPLGDLKFNQLDEDRRIHEMSFDLPMAQKGRPINSLDLVSVFSKDPQARFGSNYIDKISTLPIASRGFLTGSIDLVFTDQKNNSQASWWIADWKSNWIGDYDDAKEKFACGPMHYNAKAMEEQMLHHHYPLQAHIYLVALHRFLEWRLPNYNPKKHLGGYVYVFLRGVPGERALTERSHEKTVPGLIIEKAPIDRIIELNRLLEIGGQ